MGQLHQLVIQHGKAKARQLVLAEEQPLVDIAARVLEEESQTLGITYSGFCMAALPHKRLPDDQDWQRNGGKLSLLIEPGKLPVNGQIKQFGIPYGSRARLILLYLQTRAILENSPEVELGRSMNEWLERMDIPVGGKTYTDIKEQTARISACRLTFFWRDNKGSDAYTKDTIVASGIRLHSANEKQGSLWEEKVRLSTTFFNALRKHPVPIWEPAIRHISSRSMALDAYVWLAYRLHVLTQETPVTWKALYDQFGAGFLQLKHFKPEFRKAIAYATAVYPEARIDMTTEGITMYPSRPPIPERMIGR